VFYSFDLISLCLLLMSSKRADGKAIVCEKKQINVNMKVIVNSCRPWGEAIVTVVTVITVGVGRYGGQDVRKQCCIEARR